MDNQDRSSVEKTKELIDFGVEVAGPVATSVLDYLYQGMGSPILGPAISPMITKSLKVINDFAFRELSHREKVKAGAGAAFAYAKIVEYLENGVNPRSDGFFDEEFSGRSMSDEILEGVLFKCKNEHEEKKLRLIGNIYANTAFMPTVKIEGANWILQTAQNLTYRQLCMMAIIHKKQNKSVSWGGKDGDPAFSIELKQIEYAIYRDRSPEALRTYNETGEGLTILGLSRVGNFLYQIMGLDDIPEEDLLKLKNHFPKSFDEG
jgi:hypothetical protein